MNVYNLLCRLSKCHANERMGKLFGVHLHSCSSQVFIGPFCHVGGLNCGHYDKDRWTVDKTQGHGYFFKNVDKFNLKIFKLNRTVLNERIANKLAIIVEKPGAKHDCAIKPSFNSAKQTTSSPLRQSQLGIFRR